MAGVTKGAEKGVRIVLASDYVVYELANMKGRTV